ncbi:MAG: S9 family peptidase [Gemmatimonadaceae bacterium]|nr:S9 family peptidase [Gemmatimonadaceae bacterium]
MMFRFAPFRALLRASCVPAVVALLALPAAAQRQPVSTSAGGQAARIALPANAQGKKVLNVGDYGRWNRVTSTAISNDGRWMSFAYTPNEGDPTLHIKDLDGTSEHVIAIGGAGAGGRGGGGFGGGGGVTFSEDSRWAAYYVNPPTPAAGRGGRGAAPESGRGNAPQGRGGAQQGRGGAGGGAATRHLELLELATGMKAEFPNPSAFAFGKDSKYLAVKANRAPGADTSFAGTDLFVRDLAGPNPGTTRNIGNVNEYAFNDAGTRLAYTVDAAGKLGNGIYLLDPATGETRALSTQAATYDQMAWSDDGANLAVLAGNKRGDVKQRDNVLYAWTNAGSAGARQFEYDPSKSPGFPGGFVVSEYLVPRWSKAGSRLFVGVKEQENEIAAADSNKANVDIWHWKDTEPQSVQIVRLQQDRRSTYPASIDLASGRIVVTGDSAMRAVTATPDGKWGIGRDDKAYRGSVEWGASKADFYRVNIASGDKSPIAQKLSRTYGTSPDSKWFLYLKDKRVHAYNLETARDAIIDNGVPGGFVDATDDHAYEKPIYGVAGWSKDGKSVLLYGRFDIWQLQLDPAAGPPVNLTRGVGDKEQIEFRVNRLGAGGRGGRGGGFGGAPQGDDEGIDLSQPMLLNATGLWTKKSGFWTLPPGGAPEPLRYLDKSIGGTVKAKDADRVIYTEQTFEEFPDYWVSDTKFSSPKRVTDANPFISEYAWGGKVLIDYKNSKGQRLQGTLTLPAGYEKGRKYPMLVFFYEIMSTTHHQFSMPAFDDRPQMSTYASNGYLVFQPDVVYEIGKPGTSAVDCVTSGVKEVIRLGYADPKHIGLQGHSWGGYQSSYILTQTDMFAAVVTGAPPTNLISFYDELYKQTGTVQQGIMEVGQVRMGENVTPWNSTKLYEEQSPIMNVTKINTPFMILQGTADGAVDWIEGLQYFNAARRNGKQVIFLSYPNEPHHLAIKDNQKDFQVRMKQFFDHYLMGAPMPDWMANGLPQVRKGEPLRGARP